MTKQASFEVDDIVFEKQCDLYCDVNGPDLELADTLEHHGDLEAANRIRQEVENRRQRCLGRVIVNGVPECGLLHGNFTGGV